MSSMVMYERYWVTFGQPVQSHKTLVDAICSNVFYFNTRLTANQRLDFSCDKIDFPGGHRSVWFFWKPHLANVLNIPKLEQEGREKHASSSIIRSHIRRALVLRAINRTSGRARTTLATNAFSKRDLRCTEFRIRKIDLLDKVDPYNDQRSIYRLPVALYTKLTSFEDRVAPFMFN